MFDGKIPTWNQASRIPEAVVAPASRQCARISAMPNPSATARARKIKLILFDVDGVLTDGKIWIFPAPSGGQPSGAQQSLLEKSAQYGGQGGFGLHSISLIEAKGFHAHDGTAISLARMAGIKTGIITKRISETVALRARDLKNDPVYHGNQDKGSVFAANLQKDGVTRGAGARVCRAGRPVPLGPRPFSKIRATTSGERT